MTETRRCVKWGSGGKCRKYAAPVTDPHAGRILGSTKNSISSLKSREINYGVKNMTYGNSDDSSVNTGGSTGGSGTIPRRIVATQNETSITVETAGGVKTWKGDPTDTVKITAWKQSFEPGYKAQIMSPRDINGNYTADPRQMVTHKILTKEEQAREIAISLKGESTVPVGIIQYLGKVLLKPAQDKIKTPAPTAITDTKRLTGDSSFTSRLNNEFIGKISAASVTLLIIIVFSLHLIKNK